MTTSPPPGADSLAAIEARIDRCRDRYALPEGHIAEAASPWLPFGPQVMIKHLTFDVRSNSAANVLWVQAGGSLGRHRHRGPVSGYVLEGSWRYLEYDWVGRPGDFIRESPGRTHTLLSDEGMKTVFWLNGPVEFLDEHDTVTEVMDVFWLIDHYERGCQEQGVPVNRALYL